MNLNFFINKLHVYVQKLSHNAKNTACCQRTLTAILKTKFLNCVLSSSILLKVSVKTCIQVKSEALFSRHVYIRSKTNELQIKSKILGFEPRYVGLCPNLRTM